MSNVRKAIVSIVLVMTLTFSGCGTVVVTYGAERPTVYGGVQFDWFAVGAGNDDPTGHTGFESDGVILRVLWALDLPLSAAFDTILLPISIPWALAAN